MSRLPHGFAPCEVANAGGSNCQRGLTTPPIGRHHGYISIYHLLGQSHKYTEKIAP